MAGYWGKRFWIDLGERAGTSFVSGCLTVLASWEIWSIKPKVAWTVIGLPTVLSLLKGLLANLKNGASGASLVDHPPGPEVPPYHGKHEG